MKTNSLKPTVVLLTGLFLVGCASAPPKLMTGNEPLTVAEFTKSSGSVKLTGVKQVAIPNFYVQFMRDQTIERKGGIGSNSYTTQIRGFDTDSSDALQKIADGLYDDFVAELKAVGIEVISTATLEANADFQDLRKSARKSPYTEETTTGGQKDEKVQGVSQLVSARNLPINIMNTYDKKWLVPGVSDGFKTTLTMAPVKLSNALNVPLLNVRMTVSMAAPKGSVSSYGSMYSYVQSDTYKFDADFYPRFVEAGTLVTVQKGGAATYSLSLPVIIKDIAFSAEKGGSGSRGSGLLGLLERSISDQSKMNADAYFDVKPTEASAKINTRGREVARLFVEAMTK